MTQPASFHIQFTKPTQSGVFGIPRMFFLANAGRSMSRKISSCRWFSLLICACAACLLNGCTLLRPREDPTRFYLLTVPSAPPAKTAERLSKRWRIGLRPVELPAYLRTKSMVVETGANEIQFADFDRWAEPLDQGISRLMKETLSLADNVESVTLNSHGGEGLDYEVTLRVLACEGVRGASGNSSVRFALRWEVRPIGMDLTLTKRGAFTAHLLAWDGKDYGQMAQRLSAAIADASGAVAAELPAEAEIPAHPSEAKTAPRP